MAPCECGQQFKDLTDWKAHSTKTGHCCIYKCRRPASAVSIPGFTFKNATSSAFKSDNSPAGNAPAPFEIFPSERYHPLSYDTGTTPAPSTLHASTPDSRLHYTRQGPISLRFPSPPQYCFPLPSNVWRVPASSTRQTDLTYKSPDGTTWPAPVPTTKLATAAYYQSLSSWPALEPRIVPHPVVAPSNNSPTTHALMPRQAPSAAASGPPSTTMSAPKASKTPTAATPSAPKTVTANSILTKYTPDYRPFGCSHCERAFRVEESLRHHCKDSHPEPSIEVFVSMCDTCKKLFVSLPALQDHQRAKKHCYCSECKKVFELESTTDEHFKTSHVFHFRCCDCEQDFVSEGALDQHLNNKVHKKIPCQLCNRHFFSKSTLDQHIVAEHHASINPKRGFCLGGVHGCYICQRTFAEKSDLKQHLRSAKHRPLSDIACVASDKCKRRFASPSALLNHLESGACCSGVDRHTVNNLVRDNDPGRIISNGPVAQSFLEYNQNPSEYSSSNGTPVFTPTSSASCSPIPTPLSGNVFEQPVPFLSLGAGIPSFTTIFEAPTPPMTEVFPPITSQTSLNLNRSDSFPFITPSHDEAPALFHCPTALASTKPRRLSPRTFTTLSGLAQHIESGACGEGLATLKKAMDFVQERLDKMGLGSIRLLK